MILGGKLGANAEIVNKRMSKQCPPPFSCGKCVKITLDAVNFCQWLCLFGSQSFFFRFLVNLFVGPQIDWLLLMPDLSLTLTHHVLALILLTLYIFVLLFRVSLGWDLWSSQMDFLWPTKLQATKLTGPWCVWMIE